MNRGEGKEGALIKPPFNSGSTARMVEELLTEEESESSQNAVTRDAALETTAAQIGTLNVSAPLVRLKALIEDNFPELCPEVEAALSVTAVLRLKNAANPVCLLFEGDPASGKSTVAEMFSGIKELTHLSDRFSPAAFVSHAANRKRKELESIDLLPKIRHKLLLTPEMGPTFSGKDNDLEDKFSILTRVLDGRGLATDSGTQGHRGYQGDYFFTWIGCTTPISDRVWKIMGKLGSRVVTWKMASTSEVTVEDLISSDDDYLERRPDAERALRNTWPGCLGAHPTTGRQARFGISSGQTKKARTQSSGGSAVQQCSWRRCGASPPTSLILMTSTTHRGISGG